MNQIEVAFWTLLAAILIGSVYTGFTLIRWRRAEREEGDGQ